MSEEVRGDGVSEASALKPLLPPKRAPRPKCERPGHRLVEPAVLPVPRFTSRRRFCIVVAHARRHARRPRQRSTGTLSTPCMRIRFFDEVVVSASRPDARWHLHRPHFAGPAHRKAEPRQDVDDLPAVRRAWSGRRTSAGGNAITVLGRCHSPEQPAPSARRRRSPSPAVSPGQSRQCRRTETFQPIARIRNDAGLCGPSARISSGSQLAHYEEVLPSRQCIPSARAQNAARQSRHRRRSRTSWHPAHARIAESSSVSPGRACSTICLLTLSASRACSGRPNLPTRW